MPKCHTSLTGTFNRTQIATADKLISHLTGFVPWQNDHSSMRIARLLGVLMVIAWSATGQDNLTYTTYTNFDQVLEGRNARYLSLTRVSDPGTSEHRIYTGFFFY